MIQPWMYPLIHFWRRISFYEARLLFPILWVAHLKSELLYLAIQPEYFSHLSEMGSETNQGEDVAWNLSLLRWLYFVFFSQSAVLYSVGDVSCPIIGHNQHQLLCVSSVGH